MPHWISLKCNGFFAIINGGPLNMSDCPTLELISYDNVYYLKKKLLLILCHQVTVAAPAALVNCTKYTKTIFL